MNETIARVHILDAPYHADHVYDYYIPTDLRESATVGRIVYAPYGGGNRKTAAVIVELASESAYENVKPLLAVSDEETLLDAEALEICRFLKEYTLCTFGDAVRSVVPSAAFSKIAEYFTDAALPDAEVRLMRLGEKASFVYSFIARQGRVSADQLQREFDADAVHLAQTLLRAGLITRQTDIREKKTKRYRRFYSLDMSLGGAEALDAVLRRLRSPAQAAVLRTLSDGGEVAAEDLLAVSGASTVHLSALMKKGYISERLEDIFRNPFSADVAATDVGDSPLSEEQRDAVATLCSLYESGEAKAALLHGVTGSGKTRVMLAAIDRVIRDGRGAIVLVPEIGLTPQVVGIFLARYGERVAVVHSSLSAGERYDAWRRIRLGLADIVIGTRSAIFAPVKSLGLIVIDEEQEHTYKSDTNPKYAAHDVARFRCGYHKALLVLSSATPSVASYYKAKSGAYTLIEMKARYGRAVLPHVIITDMRAEAGGGTVSPLGSVLREHLIRTKEAGEQSIVFLNRRGYNSFISCRSCGDSLKCPHCSVSLTYHVFRALGTDGEDTYRQSRSERGLLTCHYCGYRTRVPERCPSCKSEHFHFRGYGTQRLEEELTALESAPRVLRMDMDTTQSKSSHEELLGEFRRGEADILLGTQMVTKGHDFPRVTTVGVIHADSSLYMDDYRAAERTFAMLTQVIGRAGRADKPGTAVVQTFNPTSDILTLAQNQDYPEFYRREIRMRQALVFPPFCDIAVLTLSSRDEALLAGASVRMREWVRDALSGPYADLKTVVYGPFEAPIYKLSGVCRNRMVIKCRLNRRFRAFLAAALTEFSRTTTRRITVSVDLNPNTL